MDKLFDQLKAAGDAVRQHNREFPSSASGKYIYSMSINMVEGSGAHVHIQWEWFRELWLENKYRVEAMLTDGTHYHVYLEHHGVTCTAIAYGKDVRALLTKPLPKGSWSTYALMQRFREECKDAGWDPIVDDSEEVDIT